MDTPKSTSSKNRGKLTRTRAVQSSGSSSDDAASDEEPRNFGSRMRLFREKHKSLQRSKSEEKVKEETLNKQKQEVSKPKESGFANAIKRKLGFFRKSDSSKSTENEAESATVTKSKSKSKDVDEEDQNQVVDVVVDVHVEHEKEESENVRKIKMIRFIPLYILNYVNLLANIVIKNSSNERF